MLSISDIFSEGGPFQRELPGFLPRPQQQTMAESIAEAIDANEIFVAEAGTGTGKTFAYLVPAMLSGKKVIISTGTKNLQDQLFFKDMPVVRKTLGVPVDVALLKGRSNYLCHHRLDQLLESGRLKQKEQVADLQSIKRWSRQTQMGDIGELTTVSENSPLWYKVTSTADNCLGLDCNRIDDCFLYQARRRAQEADILVINHHLLFADMALKDEGFGELLPGANAYIIDEAHQLPETATQFFGTSLSTNQLLELARDTVAEALSEASDDRSLRNASDQLEKAVHDLRLAFPRELTRAPWQELNQDNRLQAAIEEVGQCLVELNARLEPMAARGKGLDSCARRGAELSLRFEALTGPVPEATIHWFETHSRSVSIHFTPLDVDELFHAQIDNRAASWIFTSATLAVGEHFEHFTDRLGIPEAKTALWDSPFDYPRQAVLFVPKGLPEPSSFNYTRELVEQALPLIKLSGGRTFMLFTSHRALQEAAEMLAGQIDYPLLIQGSLPRGALLERFRELGNAVLLGTGSFWEGVDVRGEALSCVIIDKLPFASPGDPILKARIDSMREGGGNPFMEFQLPQAVISLKQGVGRLIRDVNDRGVMMIGDPRLVNKPYGRVFLDSLPAMTKTREFEVVERFFRYREQLANKQVEQAS